MSFLERLREKPQHVKAQYAFSGALFVTVAIGLVWATSLPARFGDISDAQKAGGEEHTDETENVNQQQTLSEILDSAKGQVGSAIDSLEESVDDDSGSLGTSTATTSDAAREVATSTEGMPPESATTSQEFAETSTSDTATSTSAPQSTSTESEASEPRVVLIATTSSETNEQKTE